MDDGNSCVVEHWCPADDGDGATEADDGVDPEEDAIDDQCHVLPVFHRLKKIEQQNQLHFYNLLFVIYNFYCQEHPVREKHDAQMQGRPSPPKTMMHFPPV